VIVEVARKSDYPSFTAFQNAILGNTLSWKNNRLDYRSSRYQNKVTLFADYSQVLHGRGAGGLCTGQRLRQPLMQGKFGKGVVTLSKAGHRVVLDCNMESTRQSRTPRAT